MLAIQTGASNVLRDSSGDLVPVWLMCVVPLEQGSLYAPAP